MIGRERIVFDYTTNIFQNKPSLGSAFYLYMIEADPAFIPLSHK